MSAISLIIYVVLCTIEICPRPGLQESGSDHGEGGDTNALAAQLQNAFAMLGGPGSMFGAGPTTSGSGVNWDVTKDTARKTAASLGPDPTPSAAQARAVVDAVGIAEVWLDDATDFPRVGGTPTA